MGHFNMSWLIWIAPKIPGRVIYDRPAIAEVIGMQSPKWLDRAKANGGESKQNIWK